MQTKRVLGTTGKTIVGITVGKFTVSHPLIKTLLTWVVKREGRSPNGAFVVFLAFIAFLLQNA